MIIFHSIFLQLQIPVDVSSLIVDNFLVLYKRCGLDTDFKEKLVPGSEVISHEIIGLSECTLYEVRVAACTSKLRGGCSAPAMIRTGGNVILLSFTVIVFLIYLSSICKTLFFCSLFCINSRVMNIHVK